ncbi:uncharacterized protein Pyn_26966 [Prunus yedoensis var. nudiflora]|uniref:Mitochondrial arginine transporter BAC2 n=1 Tax=Prunus yedoensis var. nudiflora TaxID=2094558 RepID=A0A314YSW7_PRUYE|nr:uncharacterized protein Pyn_26966 [Prunus yedoensis var. nudiflora]
MARKAVIVSYRYRGNPKKRRKCRNAFHHQIFPLTNPNFPFGIPSLLFLQHKFRYSTATAFSVGGFPITKKRKREVGRRQRTADRPDHLELGTEGLLCNDSIMDLEPGSRNSKHSEIVVDGSGGGKHSETSKAPDASDRNSPSTIRPEANANEGDLRVPSRKLISLSSLSSVASDSSLEDLFQVDTNKISTSPHIASLPKHHDHSSLGPASTSRVSDVGHGMSPTESPTVQMMERSGGYDPCRIPSSVFARSKSNKEMEWSVASNESLFSIHLGNNSFSRDHIFLLGDLSKSGELYKSGELFGLSPHPPPIPELEIESNGIEEVRESGAEGMADETVKDTARTNAEDHSEGRVPPPTVSFKSHSLSRRSDGSGASTRSFAFPILTDGMKNSMKVTQCTEEKCLEPPAAAKVSTKKSFESWNSHYDFEEGKEESKVTLTAMMDEWLKNQIFAIHALSGVGSVALGTALTYPLDTIKTLIQVGSGSNKQLTTAQVLKRVRYFSGNTGLYNGFLWLAVGRTLGVGARFGTYEILTAFYKDGREDNYVYVSEALLAGLVAGVAEALISSPFELIKLRAQVTSASRIPSSASLTEKGAVAPVIQRLLRGYIPDMKALNSSVGLLSTLTTKHPNMTSALQEYPWMMTGSGRPPSVFSVRKPSEVISLEGWGALWRGLRSGVVRDSVFGGIFFSTWQSLHRAMLDWKAVGMDSEPRSDDEIGPLSPWAVSLAAGVSGSVAAAASHCFDTAKSRSQCIVLPKFVSTERKLLKWGRPGNRFERLTGIHPADRNLLFRGLGLRMARSGIASFIMVGSYFLTVDRLA